MAAPSKAALASAEKISREIAAQAGIDDRLKGAISVTANERGVTISVTDQLDFGMFEIGSAMPRRELVLAMQKVGEILAGQKGAVSITGHTDARPFRSATYDNWRLSTARAQSTYYMLVRGGLDEQRIVEVAGHADRNLKLPDDPLAAANRRIEITLKVEP
jgi:chemotaxis protein MotB